jgi:hypothetical protein
MAKKPLDPDGEKTVVESQNLTVDKIKSFLPKGTAIKVSEDLLKMIQNIEKDTDLSQNIMEEKFVSFLHVLDKVRGVSLEEYLNAVKYCSLKKHYSNKKARAIVIPKRYDNLDKEEAFIDSHVSEYNSSDLCVEIQKAMNIPWHIEFDHVRRSMLKKQINLADGISANGAPVSAHVQHLAISKVLDILEPPVETTFVVKQDASETLLSAQRETNKILDKIVDNQLVGFRQPNKDNVANIQRIYSDRSAAVIDVELDKGE